MFCTHNLRIVDKTPNTDPNRSYQFGSWSEKTVNICFTISQDVSPVHIQSITNQSCCIMFWPPISFSFLHTSVSSNHELLYHVLFPILLCSVLSKHFLSFQIHYCPVHVVLFSDLPCTLLLYPVLVLSPPPRVMSFHVRTSPSLAFK